MLALMLFCCIFLFTPYELLRYRFGLMEHSASRVEGLVQTQGLSPPVTI
jgi:hypothetical protein